jgi:hypothetical protein
VISFLLGKRAFMLETESVFDMVLVVLGGLLVLVNYIE